MIELLAERGPALRLPLSRPLGDALFELRVTQDGRSLRVPYFFAGKGEIVLTHGFSKKTRRIPRGELRRAQAARDDWRSRHDGVS